MFMLRHYGQDGEGKRVTVNYFSARASAGGDGAGAGAAASAEVGTASVRTVVRGSGDGEAPALRDDRLANELNGFAGVPLDVEAEAAINAALEACAARARAADAAVEAGGDEGAAALADDPGEAFVRLAEASSPYLGALVPPRLAVDERLAIAADEPHWRDAGGDDPRVAIEAAVASVKRARRRSNWARGLAAPAGADRQPGAADSSG